MKKDKDVKLGSVIEAGTLHNMVTGKVKVVIGGEGSGGAPLYKCNFNEPVSIRNTIEGKEVMSMPRTTHILYRKQFNVLDY